VIGLATIWILICSQSATPGFCFHVKICISWLPYRVNIQRVPGFVNIVATNIKRKQENWDNNNKSRIYFIYDLLNNTVNNWCYIASDFRTVSDWNFRDLR
jgi:hypothetical protein